MLERFLRYVRIDTQAQEGSPTYPSTAKQLDLSRLLADELREIGLEDVELTEHGYVFATLPGTPGAPVIGLIAHVDTTPESPGTGVSPIVHRDYAGGPIVLPGDPEPGRRSGGADRARAADRSRHRHERRHDAARRRRQGRRGRDHGRRRVPPGRELVRAACDRARRLHRRRGGGSRDGPLRRRGVRCRGGLHARRLRPRGARDRDVLGASAEDPHRGARRASWVREGQARERGQSWQRTSSRRSPATSCRRRRPRTERDSCIPRASSGRSRRRS